MLRSSWILRSLLAGLVGGVVVELYLFAAGLASWPGTYQWIASTLVGPRAFTGSGYLWLGLALHALVSLGWALAYGLVGTWHSRLAAHRLAGGLTFGIAVFVAMQALLAVLGAWALPSATTLVHAIVAHTLFFGVPVALIATAGPGGAAVEAAERPRAACDPRGSAGPWGGHREGRGPRPTSPARSASKGAPAGPAR